MLHYDEYGRPGSPALLLLHGAAALDTFSPQYDLAEKYRLILDEMISSHPISDIDKQNPILGICFKDSEGGSKMDSPS